MKSTAYLVFGDIHGRVLPAFKLAQAWQREHDTPLAGLLQVGDLGYFPDPTRLDRATLRHAAKDPLELGVQQVSAPSKEADAVFAGRDPVPEAMWFTAGNHEDHDILLSLQSSASRHASSFPVDHYYRVRCVCDGQVETLAGGLRVGALWGIDGHAPRARTNTPKLSRIQHKPATRLICSAFDVLLTHDSPRDAVLADSGSDAIHDILQSVRPAFAFFGHYGSRFGPVAGYGATQVFHMAGFEMRGKDGTAEDGCVGVLTWHGDKGDFRYLEPAWLRTFTRHNWKHR